MANFHTNNLIIVADEADMKNVLRRMALNLRYNHETTGFAESFNDIEDIRQMYYLIGPYIDACYMEVFCGAPIGTEGMRIVQDADLGDGVNLQVAVAPSGRGMSETASVGFNCYGSVYVLTVDYSTAWRSNTEDLDIFFRGLPQGDYGVAFYDADEYDGYESVSVFSGLHHGGADMRQADVPLDGEVDSGDLRKQQKKERGIRLSEMTNLAKMARVVATRGWSGLWDDEDAEEDVDAEEGLGDDGTSIDFYNPPAINWESPDQFDLGRIDEAVLAILEKFPVLSEITGSAYDGRAENVERLIAGDELELVSDWNSPYFTPAGVEVFGPGRSSIGNLDNVWSSGFHLSDQDRTAIACILPRIHAYADRVVPLSIRDHRASHPDVVVRLEVVEGSLDGVLEDVHQFLNLPLAERSLKSAAREVRCP